MLTENIRLTADGTHLLAVYFNSNEGTFATVNFQLPTSWAEEHEWHNAMAEISDHLDKATRKFGEHTIFFAGDKHRVAGHRGPPQAHQLRETTRHCLRGLAVVRDWRLRWRHPSGKYIEKSTDTIL